MERIDAHFHLWRIDQYDGSWMQGPFARLKRDFLAADIEAALAESGVDGAVFVQAQHSLEDNDWVLGLAAEHAAIRGVVGWVDLTDPGVEGVVERYREDPHFVGVRHIVQNEPDPDWILRPDVQRGLAVLEKHRVPYDLLFFVQHLPHAATVADRFPDLPLVLDHLAKPRIKDRSIDDWLPAFREAARRPNVHCKLSGMVTEADFENWTPADLGPYVEHALDAFGPDRLLYGSDWPVCLVANAGHRDVLQALETHLVALSADERAAILGGNAMRFYRLPD
ncbi:MAG: amidohydrolase family protein [Planctomycetota bacterium]|nr:amidohydrolase family protein [Planctomycetota bacterium]MDA0934892.1 amidohydrolase family protein [Planctomycetota bacterium]MDA1223396.1 amidohydrolase family protein [Planctomycetota bacterium]